MDNNLNNTFKRAMEIVERYKPAMQQQLAYKNKANLDRMKKQGKLGSKNESLCYLRIKEEVENNYDGIEVRQHETDFLPGWEIDIFIKSMDGWSIAIEWDGAYHRKPIYGESNLRKRQGQDKYKDVAIQNKKCVIVRIEDNGSHNPKFVEAKVKDVMEIIDKLYGNNIEIWGKTIFK